MMQVYPTVTEEVQEFHTVWTMVTKCL